jgi:hypothetical protein
MIHLTPSIGQFGFETKELCTQLHRLEARTTCVPPLFRRRVTGFYRSFGSFGSRLVRKPSVYNTPQINCLTAMSENRV